MSRLLSTLVAGAIFLSLPAQSSAQAEPPPPLDSASRIPPDSVCSHRGSPFIGPCEVVHAAMFPSNGSPWVRLWKVGTKRVLGVWDMNEQDVPSSCPLPTHLEALLADDKRIYADSCYAP